MNAALLSRPSCADDAGSLCRFLYETTGRAWLADSANWLITRPLHILLIVALALVLRMLAHRAIGRLVTSTARGTVPAVLRPLRDRAAEHLALGPLLAERRHQRAETIGSVLRSTTSAVIGVVAFMLILGELGLNLAPLLASAGVIGVAVGFGAQNLVKDFLSGIFMILEDQYGVGDSVDAGVASGTVEAVGLRTTRMRDVNGTVWYVRNGEIARIGNSSQGWSQAVLDVPLSYATDPRRARTVLQEVADGVWQDDSYAGVILEEPTVAGVESMTREGLVIRVIVKTKVEEQGPVASELRTRIKERFAADGIELAAPPGPALAGPPAG